MVFMVLLTVATRAVGGGDGLVAVRDPHFKTGYKLFGSVDRNYMGAHDHGTSGTFGVGMLWLRMGGTDFVTRHLDYFAAARDGSVYGTANMTCKEIAAHARPYEWHLAIIETTWEAFPNESYVERSESRRHIITATTMDELDATSAYTEATGDVGPSENNYIFPKSKLIAGVRHAFVVRTYVEKLAVPPKLTLNQTYGPGDYSQRYTLDNQDALMALFNFTRVPRRNINGIVGPHAFHRVQNGTMQHALPLEVVRLNGLEYVDDLKVCHCGNHASARHMGGHCTFGPYGAFRALVLQPALAAAAPAATLAAAMATSRTDDYKPLAIAAVIVSSLAMTIALLLMGHAIYVYRQSVRHGNFKRGGSLL